MYEDYGFLDDDRLLIFGGHWSYADFVGAFHLCVGISLTFSDAYLGSRVIMFGN